MFRFIQPVKTRPSARMCGASFVLVCALALIPLVAPAVAGSGDDGNANTQVARLHELQEAFHQAASYNGDPQDAADHLELLSTLWAPDATLTVGANTISGHDAIIAFFSNAAPYHHEWVSLAPSFRTRLEPHGDTADVYFECIYVDPATGKIVATPSLSGTAKKVQGNWMFWHMQAGQASL
jgi:hypothetical protein